MILSTIRTKVRDEIKDTTTTFFSDAQINAYINQAQDAVADISKTQAEWTTDLVADQAGYAIPTACLVVETVEVDDDNDDTYTVYEPVSYKEVKKGNISGSWWYVRNRTLTIGDTPDAAVTDGLRMNGIKVPDTLSTDSDTTDLGTKYDWCLIYFAVMRCFEKRESWDKSAYYKVKYEEERQKLQEDMDAETDFGFTPIQGKWKMS